MIKGLNKYWILNIVKSIAVVFIYTSCQFLKTYMYAAVLFIWLLQRVNFEFHFKILMSSLEIQQSLSFFFLYQTGFPLCHPFPFSWTVCSYHLLILVAITQSTVLKISSGFSLYPVSGSCFPAYVSQNVCLQTKSHFPFKNELSSRWQPFKFP